MTSGLLDVAIAIVRAWTRAYTARLPEQLRDSRRAEIDSDLWEFRRDTHHGVTAALHVLFRLLLGVGADVQWRIAHASVGGKSVLFVVGVMMLIATLLFVDLIRARQLPVPPALTPLLSPVQLPAPVLSLVR